MVIPLYMASSSCVAMIWSSARPSDLVVTSWICQPKVGLNGVAVASLDRHSSSWQLKSSASIAGIPVPLSSPLTMKTRSRPLAIRVTSCEIRASSQENDAKNEVKEKTDKYSETMQQAMGGPPLTYRHELGMNYAYVLPDLIVGSCLQNPGDAEKLHKAGVTTVFCLQEDSDLAYFNLDIGAIERRVKELDGMEHVRSRIRDFDPFDLRMRLPIAVAKLHAAKKRGKGAAYVHCTAGLGRAPATAMAYMYWVLGIPLNEANSRLQKVRRCYPKLEAIRSATCDLLTDGEKEKVTLTWRRGICNTVEVSGLDVGWGQRLKFDYNLHHGVWELTRDLPVGRYEYKYIIDGRWTYNPDAMTCTNNEGNTNNYVEVIGSSDGSWKLRQRLMREDAVLTEEDRRKLVAKLEGLADAV